jgi:YfiH family protein
MQQVRTLGHAKIYFSDRNDGYSSAPYNSLNIARHVGDDFTTVLRNREKVGELISEQTTVAHPREWIFLNQTHEPNIFNADSGLYNPVYPPTADASYTQQKNRPLVVMTADCGPLVIAGESILAVVHASWRTVAAGLIEKTIETLKQNAPDEKLDAFLGPCIYPRNYEFEKELLDELSNKLGSHVISKTKDGKPAFDLPSAIMHACKDNDVDIDEMGIDTFGSPNHFSHRRDGVTGRQGVIAWLL